jgi:tetratricopeptide (TPR) repeat protein
MIDNATQLDAEELLHFAIRASQQKQNEKAILYLKHALTQEPDNARLHYFLGAQHAEIGMYDRAVEEMSRAVEIDPDLDTAHFQLGLLHATSARIPEAEQTWEALDKLGEEHPLVLFKSGLLHLARDEFDSARALLTKGIESNHFNVDLNRDMQRILDSIDQVAADNATDTPASPQAIGTVSPEESQKATGGNHIFLSAYNKDEEDEKKH